MNAHNYTWDLGKTSDTQIHGDL